MKEREGRGIKYPADSLAETIGMLETVRAAVGLSAASRETMVSALGYKTINGASARKLASLAHYGLVDRAGNGASRISALGRRILMPTSNADRRGAVAEAALRPTLFQSVYERFKGQALPGMLPNLLAREFAVYHRSAEVAAQTLRETMEHAGLVRNGILLDEPGKGDAPAELGEDASSANAEQADVASRRGISDDERSVSEATGEARHVDSEDGYRRYVVALGGDGRMAHIDIPVPVTSKDLRRVRLWVEYMEGVLVEELIQ